MSLSVVFSTAIPEFCWQIRLRVLSIELVDGLTDGRSFLAASDCRRLAGVGRHGYGRCTCGHAAVCMGRQGINWTSCPVRELYCKMLRMGTAKDRHRSFQRPITHLCRVTQPKYCISNRWAWIRILYKFIDLHHKLHLVPWHGWLVDWVKKDSCSNDW